MIDASLWPDAKVKVGTYVLIFGSAAEVLRVADSPSFCARELDLRTFDGRTTSTLVPLDFEPTLIPWAVASGPGPAPRARAR